MSNLTQEDLNRLIRLQDFFKSQEWEDLKVEVQQILNNARNTMESIGCTNREIYVGKIVGIKEVLQLEDIKYKNINSLKES